MAGRHLLRETARPPHTAPGDFLARPRYVGMTSGLTESADQRKSPAKAVAGPACGYAGKGGRLTFSLHKPIPPSFALHNDCGFEFRDP
jgi:hypothetical protein